MKAETKIRTFTCHFGKGISCTVQITADPPAEGEAHIRLCEWEGLQGDDVPRRLWPPYIAWMNSINKQLADEWGLKLMHVFGTRPKCQMWVYNPGQRPIRVTRPAT